MKSNTTHFESRIMYGLILTAIAEVIKDRYGLEYWKLINPTCSDSIGDSDGTFISRLFYDDELTYQLINNAEKILACEKYGQLSQSFGERFFELVCDSGYEGILRLLGGNLKDFLENLDSFHAHLITTYSRMKPPSFRCSHVYYESDANISHEKRRKIPDKLILHYYSERDGLEGIVMGMVRAAARELFSINVDMKILRLKHAEPANDHTEFTISILGPVNGDTKMEKQSVQVQGAEATYAKTLHKPSITSQSTIDGQLTQIELLPKSPPIPATTTMTTTRSTTTTTIARSLQMYEDEAFTYKNVKQLVSAAPISKVSPLVFAQALPFHLIFDRNLIIRQAGTSILRVIPALNTKRSVKLGEVMHIMEPKCMKGKVNFENILKYKNSIYVFRPDEKQVISGGHRHLHTDYLKKLKDDQQHSLAGPDAAKCHIDTNESASAAAAKMTTTTTTVPAPAPATTTSTANKTIISQDGLISKASKQNIATSNKENRIMVKNTKLTSTIDESLLQATYELPEADIDKYIVKLMGQMIYMKDKDLMLFVCSPSVANLDDLNNTGLFLSDIPLHDATRDLVLLSEQFEAEYKVQENLTALTEQLNEMKNELEEEKNKTDRLLYSVLPPTVANELRNNRPVPAKRYQNVSILFSGIVGFSEFCARNSDSSGAIRIVNLLNKIYTTFDVLTEPKRNPFVYKVETVGDKYMAVSGLPEACDSHARHINKLALDIQDLAKTIKLEEYTGIKTRSNSDSNSNVEMTQMDQCEHLRVTIGIHCGEVVTGVIGKRTPRYCLFGNTVNLTSRCETTGKKGTINVSHDVYELCTKDPNNFDSSFEFTFAGQVNMKGKSEPMRMWYLTRRVI